MVWTLAGVVMVPGFWVQSLSQPGPAPGDARPDCAGGQIEDLGYPGVVEPGHVPQHHRGPELFGQPGQGGVDVDYRRDRLAQLGPGLAAANRSDPVVDVGQTGLGPTVTPPEFVEGGVGGDPVSPSGEPGPPVEAGEALGDGDQGFLGGVEAVGVVAGQSPAHGVDPILVAAQELVQGSLIPGLRGRHQRPIVVLAAAGSVPAGPGHVFDFGAPVVRPQAETR